MSDNKPKRLTLGSLFAGIGGFDLGFERAGFETVWQVEIDEYCRRVLEKHFPRAERFGDIRECGAHNLKRVDVICGGFPCQPFSSAGQRLGTADDRHLWPEMLRVISALRPDFVVAENVAGFIALEDGRILDQVYSDLESEDYELLPPLMVPAASFGAWHRRDRIWICAHSLRSTRGTEPKQQQEDRAAVTRRVCAHGADTKSNGCGSRRAEPARFIGRSKPDYAAAHAGHASIAGLPDWAGGEMGQPSPLTEFERPGGREIERDFRGVAHGVSRRVDRLRGLGNAVVPQIAQWIAERIKESLSQC